MSTPKQRNNAQQLKLYEIFEAASTVVDQKMWVNLLTWPFNFHTPINAGIIIRATQQNLISLMMQHQ